MTMRLSHSSLTGTERTLVAVGTVSEASMFCAVRAGAPRRIVYDAWSFAGLGSAGLDSLGTGLVVPLAGSAALASGRGLATGAGALALASSGLGSVGSGWVGLASAGLVSAGFDVAAFSMVEPAEAWGEAVSRPGEPFADAGVGFEASGAACDPLPGGEALKYATQTGSTLWGSRWYWSNISSTSHSLAPRSLEGWPRDWSDWLPEGCGTAGFASSSDACE